MKSAFSSQTSFFFLIKFSAFFLVKSLLNSYRNCGLGDIKGLKPFGFPLFFGLRGGFPPPLPRAPSPHFVKAFQALLTKDSFYDPIPPLLPFCVRAGGMDERVLTFLLVNFQLS